MKTTTILLTAGTVVLSAGALFAASQHAPHTFRNFHASHEAVQHASSSDAPVTVSMRQNDGALCGTPFWDSIYALTEKVFAIGAANVELAEYERQIFALVRLSEDVPGANAEAFVDHIKDIPGQLVEIIRDDPKVLESCDNFSVALIGPL